MIFKNSTVVDTFWQVDKALKSMEEEAERIYKEERGLLLADEAVAVRDKMLVPQDSSNAISTIPFPFFYFSCFFFLLVGIPEIDDVILPSHVHISNRTTAIYVRNCASQVELSNYSLSPVLLALNLAYMMLLYVLVFTHGNC